MLHNTSSKLPSMRRLIWPLIIFAACTDDTPRAVTGPGPDNPRVANSVSAPPAASLTVLVTVPASMRSSPFDVDRYLTIPPTFSIAPSCNVSLADTQSNPQRAAICVYNADGTAGRLFPRGIRNAEGLSLVPGTSALWVVINNRDDIAYPIHGDWDGDGTDDYGKV